MGYDPLATCAECGRILRQRGRPPECCRRSIESAKSAARADLDKRRVKPACVVCGKPVERKQLATCSPACRAERTRRHRQKACKQCGEAFDAGHNRGLKYCSAECLRASRAAARVTRGNSDARKAAAARRRHCAFSPAEKSSLLVEAASNQDFKCAICGKRKEVRAIRRGESLEDVLILDHCHATGLPRCALCSRCNTALGLIFEDPAIAENLLEYAKLCRELAERGPDGATV